MGKPARCNGCASMSQYIAHEKGTRGTETSKYPQEEKETSISKVAASEMERGLTVCLQTGLRTTTSDEVMQGEEDWKVPPERVKVPYPKQKTHRWHQSRTGHVEPGLKREGPPSKPKYYPVTDSGEYREGKVKRTPGGE